MSCVMDSESSRTDRLLRATPLLAALLAACVVIVVALQALMVSNPGWTPGWRATLATIASILLFCMVFSLFLSFSMMRDYRTLGPANKYVVSMQECVFFGVLAAGCAGFISLAVWRLELDAAPLIAVPAWLGLLAAIPGCRAWMITHRRTVTGMPRDPDR